MKEGLMEKDKQALEKEIQGILLQAARKYTSKKRRGIWIRTVEIDRSKLDDVIAAIARLVEGREAAYQKRLDIIVDANTELADDVSDKNMTIGVLEATIETWKDIEAGHLAKIVQMWEALQPFAEMHIHEPVDYDGRKIPYGQVSAIMVLKAREALSSAPARPSPPPPRGVAGEGHSESLDGWGR